MYPTRDPVSLAAHVRQWFEQHGCTVQQHADTGHIEDDLAQSVQVLKQGYELASSQRLSYQMEGGNWMHACSMALARLAQGAGWIYDSDNDTVAPVRAASYLVTIKPSISDPSRYTFIDVTIYRQCPASDQS